MHDMESKIQIQNNSSIVQRDKLLAIPNGDVYLMHGGKSKCTVQNSARWQQKRSTSALGSNVHQIYRLWESQNGCCR